MATFRNLCAGLSLLALGSAAGGTSSPPSRTYDLLVVSGTIYDGSGSKPYVGDVAIRGDRIVYVGPHAPGQARRRIDARGLAVAPGFINMLSWANESLIADGRGQSDIRQGVTLEVMGEGWSMGPLTPVMKKQNEAAEADIRYPITWTSLGDYLDQLQTRGISPNVASFVGATTVRIHELGEGEVDPDAGQLLRMRHLVREAMEEGALGVGSSLIYPPATYAKTSELIALTDEAGKCGGGYISHMRGEGNTLLESVDEVIAIARATRRPPPKYII